MSAKEPHASPKFNDAALNEEIMRLRAVDNLTNLKFLMQEYVCIALVIGGTAAFREFRIRAGMPWTLDIPVVTLAIVLIGGLQHRLAGLGHESAHYTLLRHKFLNDLIGDIFCMFPILSTVHFYRLFHLAHHQYTNDPERDPDLVTLGGSKMVDRFPMRRWEFVKSIYMRVFTEPRAFLDYQQDYIDINVLGRSENIYLRKLPGAEQTGRVWPRLGIVLGLVYLVGLVGVQWAATSRGRPDLLVPGGVIGTGVVLAAVWMLPRWVFFQSPFRQPYSGRVSGLLRLTCYTWFIVALGLLRAATGGRSTFCFWVLWILPLVTSFPFFLLLRDVYQHTNADRGRLTNTRVFFTDRFTRWAVFVYGQDMHVPHHLFPAIPHHRLGRLHDLLKARHPEYAASVVECHGTLGNRRGLPTILDTLTVPDSEPARAEGPRALARLLSRGRGQVADEADGGCRERDTLGGRDGSIPARRSSC
jgi:fatty acid desaturase